MKAALRLSLVLLTFPGITKAATRDPKAVQIVIEAKFIEVTSGGEDPLPVRPELTLPAPLHAVKKAPGSLGTLTNSQFQAFIRELSQRKGVDLLSAPRVTTGGGQQATVEVTQKFAYKDETGQQTSKNCGVTFAVLPKIKGDDEFDLDLSPQIVNFDGFVSHKSGWKEPTFKERKAKMNVAMTSGQTTVLEMDPTTDQQLVQEEDWAGHIISSKTVHSTRRTLVFVTAYLVDPVTGKPRVPKQTGGSENR